MGFHEVNKEGCTTLIKILGKSRPNSKNFLVEFSLKPKTKVNSVYLVGSFNCWFPGSLMKKGENGTWRLIIELPEGEHPYMFAINGHEWVRDPDNSLVKQDAYIEKNLARKGPFSCVVLGDIELLKRTHSVVDDGEICSEALYHDHEDIMYFNPLSKREVIIRFRTLKNDVSTVKFHYLDVKDHCVSLDKVFSNETFDYYETCNEVKSTSLRYYFEIIDGEHTIYYGISGPRDERLSNEDFFVCDLLSTKIFVTPTWVRDSIFYQIFPDRFYNGDKGNDPPNTVNWGGKPTGRNFFGGDLRGVIEKLPYIKDLGVDAIWFTPIFKSRSNHKYNVSDYYSIDEHFGDLETFKELVEKAHNMGIRIVLDGVFHHSGSDFWAFQDVLDRGKKSRYKDWYIIHKFLFLSWKTKLAEPLPYKIRWKMRIRPPYESFAQSWGMPKINFNNKEAREYFLKVAEYWIKEMGIDGWRLDVAHGVPHDFWKEFKRRVKGLKPDAYIMGEISFFATPWLKGDEFDATMNYELYRAMVAFFAENSIDVEAFDHKLAELRKEYPLQANFVMYNFLDNHDTPRFLTLCKGDTNKMKLALIFLMTYIGAPAVFYGDEVGVQGENDPDCRRTMIWNEEKQNPTLLIFCKKLIQIRRSVSALRHGTFSALLKDSKRNLYAYKRQDSLGYVVVILNRGDKSHKVKLKMEDGSYADLITGEIYKTSKGKLSLDVKRYSGVILVPSQI